MDIVKCDTCEKQSPDDEGLYIANGWCVVKIKSDWRRCNRFANAKKLIFCYDCMPYKKGGDPTAETVLNSIKRFFGFDKGEEKQ